MLEIIDTFPAYLEYWDQVKDFGIDEQIEAWKMEYLKPWPNLIEKQIEDYASQNLDWRKIAQENVFPYLAERFSTMQMAHHNLSALCESIIKNAKQRFSLDSNVVIVIYVGIGCGAGWVTSYEERPAILFGLENIAECGWGGRKAISGLVAHEIGHLIHNKLRLEKGKTKGSGPWWQLYSEGFAQYCESLILGTESWHQAMGEDENWLSWCQENRSWLAAEFLKRVESGKAARSFFGSWFEIRGKRQTGYYLGCEVIHELEKRFDLEEIAQLDNIERYTRPILEDM